MTSSKILFYLCLAFIVGIGLESVIKIPQFILWIFLILVVLDIFICLFLSLLFQCSQEHWNNFLVVGFCGLFLLLGILRLQISEFNIANDNLSKLNDSEKDIVLTGTVAGEPDAREQSQKVKVKIDNSNSTVLVTTGRYPEYKYLDELKVTGALQTPMETEDFSYKNYLLKDHIYSVMYFPKIEKLGEGRMSVFSYFYSGILLVKKKMRQSIQSNFLPPHSSILEGMVLGGKGAISQDTKETFRITGLSHIIAISGMHVAILSAIIMYFLLLSGLWRNQAFYGAVFFILIYVALVGFPPSAVRAGIMGIIYLLGQKLGRQAVGSRIIVLAAGLMLLFNPLLLFYDVGFQLSFLAVLGLILLEPIIKNFTKFLSYKFFRFNINQKQENALSLFTITASAQIFTLPVIIYNFGNVSFVSLFTNMLILPVVPGIMFLGFLSASAGAIFPLLGWLISVPCYFLLNYFFWVVDIFSKPWAHKIISNVSWVWPVVSYMFLGVIVRHFNRRLRTKFLDY